jgi:hypothetical protein
MREHVDATRGPLQISGPPGPRGNAQPVHRHQCRQQLVCRSSRPLVWGLGRQSYARRSDHRLFRPWLHESMTGDHRPSGTDLVHHRTSSARLSIDSGVAKSRVSNHLHAAESLPRGAADERRRPIVLHHVATALPRAGRGRALVDTNAPGALPPRLRKRAI